MYWRQQYMYVKFAVCGQLVGKIVLCLILKYWSQLLCLSGFSLFSCVCVGGGGCGVVGDVIWLSDKKQNQQYNSQFIADI